MEKMAQLACFASLLLLLWSTTQVDTGSFLGVRAAAEDEAVEVPIPNIAARKMLQGDDGEESRCKQATCTHPEDGVCFDVENCFCKANAECPECQGCYYELPPPFPDDCSFPPCLR